MSVSQIAAEDGRPARFSAKTIGRVIRGERDLEPHEADWLARVLKVPVESFYEDPPPSTDDERMAAMEARLMEQADIIRGLLDTQNGLLARQSGILERIENAIAREEDVSKRLAADGDEWADRLLARLEAHRAETQTQARAPKVPAKSGTRRG